MSKIKTDDEKLRLAALKEFQILDTLPEQEFDDITLLASQICETPIAAISLIDENRQWFKSRIGIDGSNETPRDVAFCSRAIEEDGLFIVADATMDRRFSANPFVTGEPHVRFYAGAPLTTPDGYKLGTLCVVDQKPRELSESQERALNALARSVMSLIEARSLKVVTTTESEESAANIFTETDNVGSKNTSFFNQYLKHYLIATLILAIITLIKVFLGSVAQIESPFLLFASATLLASWRGGFGPGLYATLASVLLVNYYFMPSGNVLFYSDFKQNLLFLVFIGQGVFIAALCSSRLRNERLLRRAGKDLEKRVVKRTTQLAQANRELTQEIQERNVLQEDLRKAHDSAIESTRLKSEFLANMSHEIRTPMNGVIGMTGLLIDTKLDDEQKRFAQIIRTSGESLLTIINDILDFSKVEAGKLELETLDFNLRESIESLIEVFSDQTRGQHNELAALIHSDVPLALRGDSGRIRQILTNLIGNAIKFTKHGDIMVRVEKACETVNYVELKFSVTDSGEGVSEEVQAKLFQPFTQSDASTTRRFGGTGLGLSISKKLVEMMNGEIGVDSRLGKGSTFWFNITLQKQETPSNTNFTQLNSHDYSQLSGKRVLIVDDNQVNREVLMYQTRAWKMENAEAADGIKSLSMLEKAVTPFDLVILDLQMPFMDGLETALKINAGKNQPPPPIIMISSSGSKMEAEKMREHGISGFLIKPYRQSDLFDSVCQTLKVGQSEMREESDIHITAINNAQEIQPEKSMRILIVEDNSVNQMVAQNMLKNFGYHADVAANGREALTALEIIPYDLVLMDCQMPEMDGYEATREIRAREWQAKNIPIIALTAHATAGEREKCVSAGMDDYLSKPVEKENLRQMLAHWLEKPYDKNFPLPETVNSSKNIVISAVDFAALDDITDYDAEMKREVVETYLQQTVVNLSEIERAINVNDARKLYEVAHKTVGGSALCGMTAIVEPMRMLERLGREGKIKDAPPFLSQAQGAFAAIDRECRENIKGI